MPVEELDPNAPRRQPRRGDKVVAAPFNAPGCVSGDVTAFGGERISIQTGGRAGLVHIPFSRFSWSSKRRAWVCWPQDVIRTIKTQERLDDDLMIAPRRDGLAPLGAYVRHNDRTCWVLRHIGQPVSIGIRGATFDKLVGYVLTVLGAMHETVYPEQMSYDAEARCWITSSARATSQDDGSTSA